MASRYFDHTLVDMHLRLLPLTDFDFKLRAANGNDRAGSAKFKRRSATRAFVDGSPYAPQQQLEITAVARRRLLYRQSRVRADEHLRSEEHTSELQSRLHLVCRLLLEKKKNIASTFVPLGRLCDFDTCAPSNA